jgi:ABC-2 type transport system ATP-binding protein
MCDRIFMIYKGKKVLDGTLDQIQAAYGADTVRVRVDGGADVVRSVPGVTSVNDYGQLQEVRCADPQALLATLVARARVQHFEVTRPSLHDIFVRIARPTLEELQPAGGVA